ncbi:MAG: Asp-tRNA(Asn)/Glu-tRNA(Gln) amidotransferase subunit GatA [Candidatus Gracilibacteria bacterium]|nr:Asp-tRNA(Asn)/Glu-tRNA(Gln) amidotransferase subunit GatA [Candidatus Gracilibacteria bacterium]MDD3120020.1 Asp-tRNA(Asn)/Glu-tRNA(Gln) amidotransferase subunit GatA [Candidatus Gracilibacteria bacterium]
MEFKDLSLKEIIAKIKSKEVTQKEVYDYFLARIEKLDPTIEAFSYINKEFVEQDINSPLAGVPIGVKDMFCEKGVPTKNSTKMLENFVPPYDATVIKKLKKAGFNSIGKTANDPFGMGSSGENSDFKKSKNPWDPTRIPGGSSSGSATAVAAGLVPAALGTDTGGSCRQPGSMCSLVGFRPTYGRSSRQGIIAYSSSLDTPGTLTKTVEDAALLFEIMGGYDPMESTSIKEELKINPAIWDKKDLKGIKVGVPKEYFMEGLDAGVKNEIQKGIELMKSLGAEIIDISMPYTEYALSVYYIIVFAESSTNLSRYDGIRFGYANDESLKSLDEAYKKNRSEGFGKEAKRRIMLGSFVLSSGFYDAYYHKAALVRELIRNDFTEAFKKVDVIISPVSPEVAWKYGSEKVDDPIKMYLADVFTVPVPLAGVPAISVPCGFAKPSDGDKELPVGIQIIGPKLGEEKIFEVGHVFEQANKEYINSKKPEIF